MGKTRKIVFGGLIGLLTVFSLLALALLLLPKVIDPDWLKDKIRGEVSRRAGGDVDFKRLKFALIPIPYLIVDNLSWNLPQKVAGSAETIIVYPAILPLLSGKIGVRELRVRQPDVTITLQKSPQEKSPADASAAGEVMRQVLSVAGALPALRLPDVDSYVEDGRIRLMYDNASALDLQHLDARLTQASGRVEFQAACASDKADEVSLSGAVDTREAKGNARIRLTGLRPQVIRDSLGSDSDLKIQAAPVDLTLDVDIDGPERVRADLDVVIPQLTLARGERILEIRNGGLKGRMDLDRTTATV
ncbi:MAG: hypothetical protein U5R30_20140 [Deltaproteobacteria bacterium]|nr:hypothetical protein [Deltaproteobacteria bacterium]